MDPDRRRAPRYPFIADVEVTEILSNTKLRARTSDLSLGGCFLDVLNPSPQGTQIRVRISRESGTLNVAGRVAFAVPNMGMGVAFTDIDTSELSVLERWLTEASGDIPG